ncbi:hypothetical protein [Persicirhabdus sediminis]|uniref:Uncharacterized protein n=1 Tax=Persicirhabdus sediminis TaxID=454144 RepID=A0A8J7SHG3_9BACT|nr:hypothetical protein [Persicirhabdus sediminis]MBK1789824.1 hypothetical protein [Persicirhabdus sediminis]
MKRLTTILLSSLAFTLLATAQDKPSAEESSGNRRLWQANINDGSYVVVLDRISSISKHEYILEGTPLKVTEVNIETMGSALARFYYIAPVTDDAGSNVGSHLSERSRELLSEAGSRAGADTETIVAKQYPTTTHAKTIEYRIADIDDLDKLFESLRKAVSTGRGSKFTIQ